MFIRFANCQMRFPFQNLFHCSLFFEHFQRVYNNHPDPQHNILISTANDHSLSSYQLNLADQAMKLYRFVHCTNVLLCLQLSDLHTLHLKAFDLDISPMEYLQTVYRVALLRLPDGFKRDSFSSVLNRV